jgi:hypothetical protein
VHTRGLSEESTYVCWKLTPKGIATLAREYSEPLPANIVERLYKGTLTNAEHRESVARLYFGLIRCDAPEGDTPAAVRERFGGVKQRADLFDWLPDGDTVLAFQKRDDRHQAVPDATIVGRKADVRIFLEVDRGTRRLGDIRANLERYQVYLSRCYASEFPDGRSPALVYAAPSDQRAAGITSLASRHLGNAADWYVSTEHKVLSFIARRLALPLAPQAPSPSAVVPDQLPRAARDAYVQTNLFLRELKERGLIETLGRQNPKLVACHQALTALRDELQHAEAVHAGS